MQSEELKPCPFCGGQAERVDIEDGDNSGGSFVHCTVCDASGNIEFEFKENFISNWNRRAALSAAEPQPAPSVAVKALEWYDKLARSVLGYYWIADASRKYLYFGAGKGLGVFDTVEEAKAAAQADYEARIRSALSAQVQDVAGWQPIETAPKDGSEILALWKRSQIQSNGYGVVWFEDGSWREFDYECLVSDPTHWMPLPSVPAAPAKQEG